MINEVFFDDGPIQPGESRPLLAWATTPMVVEIKCFTNTPPPPGYKACPSCGRIDLESGQQIQVTADLGIFSQAVGGELHVFLKDRTGDSRSYTLQVQEREPEQEQLFEANT